ncbi:hypothetical protein [Nocardioides sp.]|uniref:hypothetical protein n=1 Tax=Nocardioides sp. TaxID=35761 RepID=UPI003D0EA436
MNEPLDLSVVVRARLELEMRRIDAIEDLALHGPSAELVDRITGGRLKSMVANQRARFAKHRPGREDFVKLALLEESTSNVTREGMSLAMGALARDAGLDHGACETADRFVRWLAGNGDVRVARMSVPGDAHAVHRSTDVIRRRVPDHGLWDLPVLAHEFGHLVVTGIASYDAENDSVGTPVDSALAGWDGAARGRATELFCDLFAGYALGPSYLCTLVFHRCDPTAPAAVGDLASHPSDAGRVHAVHTLLKRMTGSSDLHPFDAQLYWAAKAWAQMQLQAEEDARLSDTQRAEVTSQVAGWWAVLSQDLSSFAYAWTPVVQRLVASIRSEQDPPSTHFSAADVLNAAWTVRLGDWFGGRPADIPYEQRAEELLDAALDSEVQHE